MSNKIGQLVSISLEWSVEWQLYGSDFCKFLSIKGNDGLQNRWNEAIRSLDSISRHFRKWIGAEFFRRNSFGGFSDIPANNWKLSSSKGYERLLRRTPSEPARLRRSGGDSKVIFGGMVGNTYDLQFLIISGYIQTAEKQQVNEWNFGSLILYTNNYSRNTL